MELQGKHIVLGMTGGIAAYKAAELCRLLRKQGASVQVIMTEAACRFMTPTTMQALSGQEVYTSQWDNRQDNAMPHINLTRDADAVIVAPASADFIAQIVHGFGSELLALACLARPVKTCPLLIAPAMNREMWQHPATQRNVSQAIQDGAVILGPASGDQACGEEGSGRMLEAADIFQELVSHFQPKLLAGHRVLVTAGPTFEPIDPVRGITNLSSGKMGFALAHAVQQAGADVTLIAGPIAQVTPPHVRRIDVVSAQEMYDVALKQVKQHDIFVATAAVADWRIEGVAPQKIKKTGDGAIPALKFVENPDILAAIARLPQPPYCVGFAAESENLLEHAREKRVRKNIPLIVGNLGPETFGKDDNQLLLIDAQGHKALPRSDKLTLARQLVAEIAQRINDSSKS